MSGLVNSNLLLRVFCCNAVIIFKTFFKLEENLPKLIFLKEADAGVRCISVLTNIADQLYYPCEHIAWAADAELIKVKSDKWWLLCTVLWGTSLLLGILRCGNSSFHAKREIAKPAAASWYKLYFKQCQ